MTHRCLPVQWRSFPCCLKVRKLAHNAVQAKWGGLEGAAKGRDKDVDRGTGMYYTYNLNNVDHPHHESLNSRIHQEYGTLADKALTEPLTITKNGRDRFVLVEAGEFERLKRRDRKVYATGEMPDALFELIKQSKMPAGYEHLDEELKDWKP